MLALAHDTGHADHADTGHAHVVLSQVAEARGDLVRHAAAGMVTTGTVFGRRRRLRRGELRRHY